MTSNEYGYHIKVEGLVQGVFFRQSTKQYAIELGITGWVKNCADGTVELVIFANEQSRLVLMLDWLKHGPDSAIVKNTIITKIIATGFSTKFFKVIRFIPEKKF